MVKNSFVLYQKQNKFAFVLILCGVHNMTETYHKYDDKFCTMKTLLCKILTVGTLSYHEMQNYTFIRGGKTNA